jgi:hypothetical protein
MKRFEDWTIRKMNSEYLKKIRANESPQAKYNRLQGYKKNAKIFADRKKAAARAKLYRERLKLGTNPMLKNKKPRD